MSVVLTVFIVFFVLFLLTAAVNVLIIGPLAILQPTRRKQEWYRKHTTLLEPKDANLPQENLTLTTRDGLKLACWFVPHPRPRATIILLHGVGDNKTAGVALARFFYNHGYNIFLYDSRRHGDSEGIYCTYGFYEKFDAMMAIDHLLSRPECAGKKIGLIGTSMGAAVAIQTAAIDARVAAVVAEASFTDLRTIAVDYQKRLVKLPWHFLRNVAMTRTQRYGNFKARFVSPLNDVSSIHVPILFIHGTADRNIKPDYSEMLFERANEPKRILRIEGAEHTNQWEVGGTVYENSLLGFINEYLP